MPFERSRIASSSTCGWTSSATYASPGSAPIAARSDSAAASARWPTSAPDAQSSRKCTPSTIASTDVTANGRARTTAASSPLPRAPAAATIASISANSSMAVDDPCPVEVVGRELYAHAIAGEDADAEAAHLARHVPEDRVAVVELDAEHGVGQRLDNLALELDLLFLRHASGTVLNRSDSRHR